MGHRRHVFLVVSLALLILVSTTHAAGGHATQAAAITQQGKDGVVGSIMVGSSPPSCEGKCGWWCVGSSCEAVLVPIEPSSQDNKQIISRRRHGSGRRRDGGAIRASPAAQFQRQSSINGDHDSNYKPVTWTCKCVGASS